MGTEILALILIQAQRPSNPLLGFLPILLIFAIFYFLLFLPMQRQRKRQEKMLQGLKSGDQVLTSGGIIGTIVRLEGDRLILRTKPDNVRLEIARNAVASVLGSGSES